MKVIALAIVMACVSAHGQDAATMAAQQAMQANQQALQQAQQASQEAMQQAQQASQQANDDAIRAAQQNSTPMVGIARQPVFNVKSGPVAAGTEVRIKSSTHYAVIYYTTNGWTPTTASRRYTGPIPIQRTTELQAIAVAPNILNSLVARAQYTVQGTVVAHRPVVLPADGVLYAGTRLHLVTGAAVNSKTAQVGDKLALLLDQDVTAGDTVIAAKGTPVEATITQADPAGHAGTPGDISFQVHFLTVNGTRIALNGGETLEGPNHYTRAKSLFLIPAVGVSALLLHGDEAEIKPGMELTAAVATDTPLHQ
jgi:hypothetical protein